MGILGGKSGFKTVRDLVLFVAGLGVCFYHIATTPADKLNIGLLIFGASLAGLPSVIRADEKNGDK